MAIAEQSLVWTAERIKENLALLRPPYGPRSQAWVGRSLVVLFQRQTADEQNAETTTYRNGRGFAACHAEFGSSLAKAVLAGRTLTDKQIAAALKFLPRYARQLAEAANGQG